MRIESGQSIVASSHENALLCTIEIPPEYHIYWCSAGASGVPTEIVVDAPEWCASVPSGIPGRQSSAVPKVIRTGTKML